VLILSGDKDPFFGPAVQAELRRALPGAKSHAFPDAGHNLIWEDPKGAAEAINAFLAP
jgi:pimeloyl-ACP methyl ester carboxylesterase